MPRYKYVCSNCTFTKSYFHGINEVVEVCEKCEQPTMKKDYSSPFILNVKKSRKKSKVGELTKQAIEENKEILEQQKKEAKKEMHEPS
jgi:predicted nucleic acid-binding Zn ribbon protein